MNKLDLPKQDVERNISDLHRNFCHWKRIMLWKNLRHKFFLDC